MIGAMVMMQMKSLRGGGGGQAWHSCSLFGITETRKWSIGAGIFSQVSWQLHCRLALVVTITLALSVGIQGANFLKAVPFYYVSVWACIVSRFYSIQYFIVIGIQTASVIHLAAKIIIAGNFFNVYFLRINCEKHICIVKGIAPTPLDY